MQNLPKVGNILTFCLKKGFRTYFACQKYMMKNENMLFRLFSGGNRIQYREGRKQNPIQGGKGKQNPILRQDFTLFLKGRKTY